MKSVDVALRGHEVFVTVLHGSGGGDPCVAAGPVARVARDAAASDLGALIRRQLALTTHDYPFPASRDDWAKVTQPLFEAAGVKTWSAFAKKAVSAHIDQRGDTFEIIPTQRTAKGSFLPGPEPAIVLDSPSDETLGREVANVLARSWQRQAP